MAAEDRDRCSRATLTIRRGATPARAPSLREIAARLPDVPRFVEVRDLLRTGTGELFGVRDSPELSIVVRDPESHTIWVVGQPERDAVRAAIRRDAYGGELLVAEDQAEHFAELVVGWTRTRAILHLLEDRERLPTSSGEVRFLEESPERLDVPRDLKQELIIGAASSPIAASFVAGRPVAFCYAGSITETLWDVAIDTLADHRRQGHAARCAGFMIRHMEALGQRPVWGAAEDNAASWRLARKLGFVEVDRLVMFESRPG